MGRHVLEVVDLLHATGSQQAVSLALLDQTHATGLQASFLSYLTTCHGRSQPRRAP